MGKLTTPHDPALNLAELESLLRQRMGDRFRVEQNKRVLLVHSSDWYGVAVAIKQKPGRDTTTIRTNTCIPRKKNSLMILPLGLLAVVPWAAVFLGLLAKAKPIQEEILVHLNAAPKPLSAVTGT